MRLGSFVLISVSALALAACNTTSGTKASTSAQPANSSSTEAQEMSAVMGGEVIDVTAPVGTDMSVAVATTPGVPSGCPIVDVLPDTRSITYFEGNTPSPNAITARAAIKEIRGGCEYQDNAVVVDIDMVMDGMITDKARYEGRKDLEAFMTFPYFIAVMDPQGNMIDKKIMATAMRFKPNSNDLVHAEKITQTIPLSDIGLGSQYVIATGFQLTRAQLEYNRGSFDKKAEAPKKEAAPKKKAEAKTSVKPAKQVAQVEDKAPAVAKETVKEAVAAVKAEPAKVYESVAQKAEADEKAAKDVVQATKKTVEAVTEQVGETVKSIETDVKELVATPAFPVDAAKPVAEAEIAPAAGESELSKMMPIIE